MKASSYSENARYIDICGVSGEDGRMIFEFLQKNYSSPAPIKVLVPSPNSFDAQSEVSGRLVRIALTPRPNSPRTCRKRTWGVVLTQTRPKENGAGDAW